MNHFAGRGGGCLANSSAGASAERDRRGLVRAGIAAGAALLMLVGFGFAAGSAESATRLSGSGPVTPFHPLSDVNSRLELFTMSSTFTAASSNDPTVSRLTNNGDSDYNPKFAPGGTKLVYVKNGGLWTMEMNPAGGYKDALAGSELPLTAMASQDTYVGGWCKTAGNREFVVFQRSTVALSFEVYMVEVGANRLAAGPEIALTRHAANDSQPSVTSDCSKIAFHSNRAGTGGTNDVAGTADSDIWTANLDTANVVTPLSNLANLTNCSAVQESAPSISPDGTTIAFQTNRIGVANGTLDFEIYRMDAVAGECGASGATRLTENPPTGTGAGLDLTGYDLNPAISPDGSTVCFHSGRSTDYRDSGAPGIIGQWEIYTVGIAGEVGSLTDAKRKTNRPGNDERCSWQATN